MRFDKALSPSLRFLHRLWCGELFKVLCREHLIADNVVEQEGGINRGSLYCQAFVAWQRL